MNSDPSFSHAADSIAPDLHDPNRPIRSARISLIFGIIVAVGAAILLIFIDNGIQRIAAILILVSGISSSLLFASRLRSKQASIQIRVGPTQPRPRDAP